MIVGNGMIAKNLACIDRSNVLFFASGVSDSLCTDKSEYEREIELLKNNLNTDKKFIYFSSIDEYILNSQYLLHKKEIQSIIQSQTDNHIIIKVPQLIGENGNPNNFINYIYNSIKNEIEFNVIITKRSLLDISDLVKILDFLLHIDFRGIFNINYIELQSVTEYIEIIEKISGKKAKINKITTIDQDIKLNDEFVNKVIKENIKSLENYNLKIIQKYKN
jgi:nucleoside-diphosphate-sugar epimerase